MSGIQYQVILFNSVSAALRAEKIFKEQGIPHKIIPVPRQISSDCGICIRINSRERVRIEAALAGKVDVRDICAI